MSDAETRTDRGPRNLVFCCDGTANEYGTVNTNVVHLYRRLANHPDTQINCYEPGVGTFSPLGVMDGGKVGIVLGKLFGHGLTENIENGYRFLMRHYREGDRVFLFGFSRGAYAVRALSGMLEKCGLLDLEQDNLIRYADAPLQRRERRGSPRIRRDLRAPLPGAPHRRLGYRRLAGLPLPQSPFLQREDEP
ncbi:MAG: DUF2235 domain-containing protein [Arhodomonas sp.]|nr:DUF2235 domain-containing protein [Arhodomonas sp.]